MESGMEQSFLIKINPPRAVENVSWHLKYPHDGRRWRELIYMSRKENDARMAMVRDDYRVTRLALEGDFILSSYNGGGILERI
jgi:hypothetical protein